MRFDLPANGHDMEIIEVCGMGEGVEELMLWCHTCDEPGERVLTYDMEHYPKWRLAMAQARQDAYQHAYFARSKTDPLTPAL